MNDSIKKMLRITEKDLMITEVSYETLQKKKTLVVDAVLSPTPRACRSCGSTVVDGNGKAMTLNVDLLMALAAIGACLIGNYFEGAMLTFIFCLSGAPIGRLKVILSNPDIQSQIMLDIKLLLY
ncbi:hypothetical protein EfmAA610_13370 [Enterococcus faecium]|nr:hypothetical protein EfmAA610_13370 [Enterococcus faecium]